MADAENPDDIIGHTLFGEPVYRVRRKRGRPPFEWTEENSHKVSMLLAMGWGNERIAGCIVDPRTGKTISTPTLKRYFRSELAIRDQARDQLFTRQMMALAELGFGGNVGALRELQRMVEKNDLALITGKINAAQERRRPEEKLGKKEQARRDAGKVAAGGGDAWGDDLKPGGFH
ncbi:resolvase [Pseudooceanicola sp. C21-150M6]|uniref:resolvase n=1 Tax=Pseudooceanicola sp. C21-150M6 TaxID=3434355 RepID=UPI003D7FBC6D